MNEKIKTRFPMHKVIQDRWSPVTFSQKDVTREKLQSIFEAARWAASSRNEQPWRFIIVNRDSEDFSVMVNCLAEKNAEWAQNAPYLVMAIAKTRFARNNKPNRHAFYDTGQAVENLILQATELDLYAHQMGGFDLEKAVAVFAIPEGFEPVVIIALGYRDISEKTPKHLSEREKMIRTRIDFDQFIFGKKFGVKTNYFTR